MANKKLIANSKQYLELLCNTIGERPVGSENNREAARFFEGKLAELGWATEAVQFEAVDWYDGGATLRAGAVNFEVFVSPYSLSYQGEAELVSAETVFDLERCNCSGKLLLLHGDIAAEPLMPKKFVFYNPEEHQRIIALLEKSGALAIICATGRNASLGGGLYPFPLIEDGDFDIPSVYMSEEEGAKLLSFVGQKVNLKSSSRRINGSGCNVIGKKGNNQGQRIVVTAHIDSKKGSPGAIDNASGVIVLLLLADLLADYTGPQQVELVALNGEDYYAASGQMSFIAANQGRFDQIMLNINIDGAGYMEGESALSFYELPSHIAVIASKVLIDHPALIEGSPWPQGDHSIFLQNGRPAIAATSKWFTDNIDRQEITHTAKDNPGIVDCRKLVELAEALNALVRGL